MICRIHTSNFQPVVGMASFVRGGVQMQALRRGRPHPGAETGGP